MPGPLTRRTLVRSTAHAAWAVPAITVASAAPAFACSPGTDNKTIGFAVEPILQVEGSDVDVYAIWTVSGLRLINNSECVNIAPESLILTIEAWTLGGGGDEEPEYDVPENIWDPAGETPGWGVPTVSGNMAQWTGLTSGTPLPLGQTTLIPGSWTFDTAHPGYVDITVQAAGWPPINIRVGEPL